MTSNNQPLSPEYYSAYLRFTEDELFVARQVSLGHEMPKIETQLQVKMFRASKKGARELFTSICTQLHLHGLGSEEAMVRTVALSYKKFAEMCRASTLSAAKPVAQPSKQNAARRPSAGTSSQVRVPRDIIGYYKLDLDVLAGRVPLLAPRHITALECLRTGEETGSQVGARMGVGPTAVSAHFNDIYKRLEIQHIKRRHHKRIIARLAHLRWVAEGKPEKKKRSRGSPDST